MSYFFLLLIFAMPNLSSYAVAQTATTLPRACESVRLSGIDVVCIEQGIGSFTPRDRAEALADRLKKLAAEVSFDPSKLEVQEAGSVFKIVANNSIIFTVTEGEFPDPSKLGTQKVAEKIAEQMRAAIIAIRLLQQPDTLMWGIGKTVSATVILFFFLLGLRWFAHRIHAKIVAGKGRYIRTWRIQTFEILNAARIVGFLTWLTTTVRILVTLLALYVYVPLVLSFFPWTETWSDKLIGYLVTPFVKVATVFIHFIPNIFFIAVICLLTRYFLKLIRFIFVEIERGNLRFDGFYKEWSDPTYKLVRVIVIAFAFVMAFPYLPGSSSPAFQGVSVFLGVLLSLGSSSAIGNIVAGVVITYMRPFKIGDRVKIADTVGDVLEKNLLVTRIKSIKHVEITIPNSMVLGSHIVNYSSAAQDKGLILNTSVTIGYDVPWSQVDRLLREAARRTEQIDQTSKAFVLHTALNDFHAAYELNAFTKSPNDMAVIYSELHKNIKDCFNEAGVEIMSPNYNAIRDGNAKALGLEQAPAGD